MSGAGPIIRQSRDADVAAITEIYGYHVVHGVASFEETPPTLAEIASRRSEIVGHGLPYLVAEQDGQVIGYCYTGLFRPRPGYRFTLEDSIYIAPAQVGRGVGRALLEAALACSAGLGYRQIVAVIGGSETIASIRLHAALGFAHIGVLPAVGFKFGRWVDVVLMQRALGAGAATLPQS